MLDIKPIAKIKENKRMNRQIELEIEKSGNNLIKKIVILVLIIFFVLVIIFYFFQENKNEENNSFTNVNDLNNKEEDFAKSEEKIINTTENNLDDLDKSEKIIKNKSNEAINALKNKDFNKLASLMNSNQKLFFSPYANFNETNQKFNQSEIENISSDSNKYVWGKYNGINNDAINLNFKNYYDNFIYDQDYSKAENITYNKDIGMSKIKNNAQDFFPNSITVEYNFSGFDSELKEIGADWKSLRLVFVKIKEDWYLAGISHDEFTI